MPRIPDDPDALKPPDDLRRNLLALADLSDPTDPLLPLFWIRELLSQLPDYQEQVLREALALGYTWSEVSTTAGMSRATVTRKLGAKSAQGPGWTRKGRTG